MTNDSAPAAEEAAERAEKAAVRAGDSADEAEDSADEAEDSADKAEESADRAEAADDEDEDLGESGAPFAQHTPFYKGFFGGLGALLAFFLFTQIQTIGSVLVLVVVALFLAAGLNPAVEFFERRGLRRPYAVLVVVTIALSALALFLFAIVPVITEQVSSITSNTPGWLDQLQRNQEVQDLDDQYGVIDKVKDYVADGDFVSGLFGGVLGVGLKVLSVLLNSFLVIVMTLYFLASLDTTKSAFYQLAPASRRPRVARITERIVRSVGAYVSGAFIVATCAGITSLIFLFIAGLGQYAVALAFVVALLDVIPMIGATIGAVIVTAIGFAEDPKIGVACVIFYLIYQQVENYLIYPRVMSRAVDVPGVVTVIAALVGATLLGVIGALLAIPTAAAILMLTRELVVERQDAR